LLISALIAFFNENLIGNLIVGGIVGLVIGAIIMSVIGKPVHLSSGGNKIWFDNEEYHKRIEQLNNEDVVKNLIHNI
jgi:hypothetical protein